MTTDVSDRPWEALADLVAKDDATAVADFLDELAPGEAALAISRLDTADQTSVLTLLLPEDAADLLEQLPDAQAADLIEELRPQDAAAILHELPSDEQADLVGELQPSEVDDILSHLDPTEAGAVRALATYPTDVAGGLMVTEYLAYPEDTKASEVVDDLRGGADDYADFQIQYVYVTNRGGQLTGVLRLRDLLLSRPERSLQGFMLSEPLMVDEHTDLDDLRSLFDRHPFLGLPVVDRDKKLVGVVRRAGVDEAMAAHAESDYRLALGIVGGEELRTMPVLARSRRRLSWLSINIVLNIVAASVIALYQDTLAAVIALAAFLPIVSDMSGCSGNQAVAVSIRELSLGLVRPTEVARVWFKEVSVGMLNGVALGILLGIAAWLWQRNVYLGLVVGGALAINTVIAVSIGGVVPLVLKRFNLDPALASGPILTTVTDLCGFLLTLSFAAAAMSRLV